MTCSRRMPPLFETMGEGKEGNDEAQIKNEWSYICSRNMSWGWEGMLVRPDLKKIGTLYYPRDAITPEMLLSRGTNVLKPHAHVPNQTLTLEEKDGRGHVVESLGLFFHHAGVCLSWFRGGGSLFLICKDCVKTPPPPRCKKCYFPSTGLGGAFECVSFSLRTKVGVQALQHEDRKVHRTCRLKKKQAEWPTRKKKGKTNNPPGTGLFRLFL